MDGDEVNSAVISRYMSFNRFVDMCRKGLFVPNANRFSDVWEGLLAIIALIGEIPKEELRKKAGVVKSNFFVSCWHKSEEENMAMWKLYGRERTSICVETTIKSLIDCCSDYAETYQFHNVSLAEVGYVLPHSDDLKGRKPTFIWDYWDSKKMNPTDCQSIPMSIKTLQGLTFKHKAYSYEKEIRVIYDTFMRSKKPLGVNKAKGIRMKLSKNFFHKIILSPDASNATLARVKKVLDKYGYDKPIIKMSDLNLSNASGN